MRPHRLAAVLVSLALLLAGCAIGPDGGRVVRAKFSRAIQVFPGVKARVLGVDVGVVTGIRNVADGVEVVMRLDDPEVKIPADVNAAIVPQSLLGVRYMQLFPAYEGGPVLEPGATIPLSRTAVPSEPDELLAALQDYLGALDPEVVGRFVENAAEILEGRGDDLNRLIEHAAGVQEVLAAKRQELATLVVELNKITVALSSRQQALGRVIRSYNAVASTLTGNRDALEGTITGLADAATELASLLAAHETALDADIDTLTTTGRTLDRNAESLARTGRWATRLFTAASHAIDFEHDWLRLNNQGEPLAELILQRLQERLVELCRDLGATECGTSAYWAASVPSLFCFEAPCAAPRSSAADQLRRAFDRVPELRERVRAHDRRNGGDGSTRNVVEELLENTLGDGRVGGEP